MAFNELVTKQQVLGEEIQQVILNYKKDPNARKVSTEYFEERLHRISTRYHKFAANDVAIKSLADIPLQHEYFSKEYYGEITNVAHEYMALFEQKIEELRNAATAPSTQSSDQRAIPQKQGTSIEGLIRRQNSAKQSLRRLLSTVLLTEQQPSYYKFKSQTIRQYWQQIEALNLEIWDVHEDPATAGYNFEEYLELEAFVQEQITQLMVKGDMESGQPSANHASPTALPLPKVSIPTFDGDYLKWTQFHDMFTQLVHNQNLPLVQKMWYLKTSLKGEAEKLIQHIPLMEQNYNSALSLLRERFSNKRVLVSSLLAKLLDHPTSISSASELKTCHDTIQECLLALENVGVQTASWGPILTHLMLPKLERHTRLSYEQQAEDPRKIPSTDELLSFIKSRFQALEASGFKEKQKTQKILTTTTCQTSSSCTYCHKDNHPLFKCEAFIRASTEDRIKAVQQSKLCFNCLQKGHPSNQCKSRCCKRCNKRHNTLLHREIERESATSMTLQSNHQEPVKSNSGTESSVVSALASNRSYVLLGTVRLNIVDAEGQLIECRAVLDSGSQINLITERLAKRLSLPTEPMNIIIEGIGKGKAGVKCSIKTAIQSNCGNYKTNLQAFIIPKIVADQPTQKLDIANWIIPKDVMLADAEFYKPGAIDLLIGAELYHKLLLPARIELSDDLPLLQNTVFGWMFTGRVKGFCDDVVTCGIYSEKDEELSNQLAKFWELDEMHFEEVKLTESERQCEALFAQHTYQNSAGQFVVKIPFKENPSCIGNSDQLAASRFYSLERRLAKQPQVKSMYVDFMREYERLGHMSKIDLKDVCSLHYVIPHHCIVKPDSSTTKLRVVFDASAKTSNGISLNDIMHNGPVVQCELSSILMRFRAPRFVFTTDIEKMYRQILTHPDDRRFQIIRWREHPHQQLWYYKLNTVTYGTRAAPYLATKCLVTLAKKYKLQFPLGSSALEKDFYVDDGLSGSNNLREAIEIKKQLIQILSSAGFKLRKWCANHPQLLEGIPMEDHEVNLDFSDNQNHAVIKTLGLIWLPKSDELAIKTRKIDTKTITKRTVTSELAHIYDPLGLVAPVVVKAKIFVQQLWQLKLGWDDELPAELQHQWLRYSKGLHKLDGVRVPRHLTKHEQPVSRQLHVFTDASERAYGAAVYLRAKLQDRRTMVQLICSKTRVAPLKTQTIPRLELCGALLGAELVKRVLEDLQYKDTKVYMWTDSEIVLHWINSDSSNYQTFVAHRITKIQALTIKEQWRHVVSKDNPADIISRGLEPERIKECSLWFYGPIFLSGDEDCWPPQFVKASASHQQLEVKRKLPVLITSEKNDLVNMIYKINHGNSFKRLLRIVAYVLRFTIKRKFYRSTIVVEPAELENALNIVIKAIQESEFEEEIKAMTNGKELKTNSNLLGLSPFIDSHGIIRVGGRLIASSLNFNAKHPMLLPYNDTIVKLIMQNIHEESMHCSPQTLLAQTRQRFWPIKGKVMARSITQHCIRCTRAKPKMFHQIMGNLPSDRVTPHRPFFNAGVDFFGPVWIHYKIRGKRPSKAYVAVFCCFATKAVHLELVSDLTTEAFLGALNRFVARRGRCQNLYCDNATNFVGAKNQLEELKDAIYKDDNQDRIMGFCANQNITFRFIPPRAPHFGGLWEAAVKSTKYLLLRSVGSASLTYEELETVIVQAEAILNSRPITPLSTSPNDLAALTPGHFLIGEPLTSYPSSEPVSNQSTATRWQLVKQIRGDFWSRWSKEYLNELQQRHRWKDPLTPIVDGTLVIIKDDNAPPLQWALGRIVKTYKGNDGLVRVADVKTERGIIKRPIHNLAPLLSEDNTQQSTVPVSRAKENEHNDHETPQKRSRLTPNISLATILMILILPLALGAPAEIIKSYTNPGIHFEGIGSAHIIATNWNLIIYYDLLPFKTEMEAFHNGTAHLHNLCKQLKQENLCSNLVTQFQHIQEDLEIDNSFIWKSRVKRGALNLVGNLANSLFGVLDSDYAEQMRKTIQNVQENEEHLLHLAKNQTSVIDSTINIIKRDQAMTKSKFDDLDKRVKTIISAINITATKGRESEVYQLLSSLSIQLSLMSANLRLIQSAILKALTDTHHGQVGPLLLSPKQLQSEMIKIKTSLPASLQLPVPQDDLRDIYKLTEAETVITGNFVIFSVKIPLIATDQFKMFRVMSIPTLVTNNTMMAITVTTNNLAITDHGDKYFPMSKDQVKSCKVMGQQQYLCPNPQAIFNKGAKTCLCEIQIFHNESETSCVLREVKDDTWISLNDKNKWIFAVKEPLKMTAVCEATITQLSIHGSGMLKAEPNCVMKHDSFTVLAHDKLSSEIRVSYTNLGRLPDLMKSTHSNPQLLHEGINPYVTQLKELSLLQSSIQKKKILELPHKIEQNQNHHYIVSYAALMLAVGIISLKLKNIIKARLSADPARGLTTVSFPIPAPRRSPTPDFSIHV